MLKKLIKAGAMHIYLAASSLNPCLNQMFKQLACVSFTWLQIIMFDAAVFYVADNLSDKAQQFLPIFKFEYWVCQGKAHNNWACTVEMRNTQCESGLGPDKFTPLPQTNWVIEIPYSQDFKHTSILSTYSILSTCTYSTTVLSLRF